MFLIASSSFVTWWFLWTHDSNSKCRYHQALQCLHSSSLLVCTGGLWLLLDASCSDNRSWSTISITRSGRAISTKLIQVHTIYKNVISGCFSGQHLQQEDTKTVHVSFGWNFTSHSIFYKRGDHFHKWKYTYAVQNSHHQNANQVTSLRKSRWVTRSCISNGSLYSNTTSWVLGQLNRNHWHEESCLDLEECCLVWGHSVW